MLAGSGCEEQRNQRRIAEQQRRADSLWKANQLRAWKYYAEDLYYFREAPKSTFAPDWQRKPGPPPEAFLTGVPNPADARPREEASLAALRGQLQPSLRLTCLPDEGYLMPSEKQLLLAEIPKIKSLGEQFSVALVGYASNTELANRDSTGIDVWRLSADRVLRVTELLVAEGISPHRIEAVARGAYHRSSDQTRNEVEVYLIPVAPKP